MDDNHAPAATAPTRPDGPAPGPGRRTVPTAAPWHGAVVVGLFFASAAVLITYTLVPLPGQRAFGTGNYWLAGALFAAQLVVSRLVRAATIRAAS